jgi:glycosyltransferase involved in cell wall biosynthesis
MSRAQPLVSILIPTYNRAGMLTQAIESAVGQTYRRTEIVVADNCSTDSTPEVVAAFAARDDRIRSIRQPENRGYLGNMQTLFEAARGEFVKFVMDDDVLLPDCVESLLGPCLADSSVVLATSKRTLVDVDLRPLPDIASTQGISATDGVFSGREVGDLILRTNVNLIGEASTAIFRRELLDPLAPFRFGRYDFEGILDVSLWLKLLARGNVYYSATPKSLFRFHAGQGGADYIAPFFGTIEWGRIIEAARELGFLVQPSDELEAWGAFLRAAGHMRTRVTDPDHLAMLEEAIGRAGDRLSAFTSARGGAEERTADGRAARALRELDRNAVLAGARPAVREAAAPDFLALVPDGTEPVGSWREPLYEVLRAFSAVGAVAGQRLHPDGRPALGRTGAVAIRPEVARQLGESVDLDAVRAAGWDVSFAAASIVCERVPESGPWHFPVSVVVPVRNPGDVLLRCLTALSDHTDDGGYETVIVDRDSDDGTGMLLDCLEGDVQVIRQTSDRGYSAAATEGVWTGRGEHVVLLPADVEVAPGWLGTALAQLDSDGRAGAVCVGGAVLFRRSAYADGSGIDDLSVPGSPVDRLLGRLRRRGWSVVEL